MKFVTNITCFVGIITISQEMTEIHRHCVDPSDFKPKHSFLNKILNISKYSSHYTH